jgi:WD40 repeat protein
LSNNSGSVAWSPDSQFLVLPGEAGMQVFKSTNGELVQTFNALTGPVETLAWSPSGREVVRATGSGHIAALDAQKGDIVATYDGDLIQNCFAFSPDGKFLAIKTGAFANTSGEVTVYNLADSNFRKVLKDSYGAGMTGESFSRDGAYLAIQGFDDGQNVIQIWKTSDWSLFRSWKIPKGLINGLIFNADGQTVALTYSDDETNSDIKSILILRSIDGSTVQNLPITSPIGRPIIYGISFSPDGQSLLSVSEAYFSEQEHHLRQVLKLWQTSNDKLLYSLDDIPERKRLSPLFRDTHYLLNSIAWSPDGTLFAVGMSDGTLQVRRASDGELLQTLSGHTLRVTAAAFSPDGRLLASGSLDGTIRIWGILQNP